MESKDVLTINGWNLRHRNLWRRAINAANQAVINGYIYCYSSGNDGIDSNGTLTVTGGIVIASAQTVRKRIDCDRNTFSITGGVLIGTGGSSGTPSSACSQRSCYIVHHQQHPAIWSTYKMQTVRMCLRILNCRVLIRQWLYYSGADLKANTNYAIYTGGSISVEKISHGYYTGAVYTPGTKQPLSPPAQW